MNLTEVFLTLTQVLTVKIYSYRLYMCDNFQFYNTYHLVANDNSAANVSLWLVDEPTDKITETKPTYDTAQ
jgi:hypothetical protein